MISYFINTYLTDSISSSGERSASELVAVCIAGILVFFLRSGLSSDTSMLPRVAASVLQGSSLAVLLFKLSSSSIIKNNKFLQKSITDLKNTKTKTIYIIMKINPPPTTYNTYKVTGNKKCISTNFIFNLTHLPFKCQLGLPFDFSYVFHCQSVPLVLPCPRLPMSSEHCFPQS